MIRVPRRNVIFPNPDASGTDTINSEWLLKELNDYSNLGTHVVTKKSKLKFHAFKIDGQIGETIIDTVLNQITIQVKNFVDLSQLKCNVTFSENCQSSIDFSRIINYSEPIVTLLQSEEEADSSEWIIKILKANTPVIEKIELRDNIIYVTFDHYLRLDQTTSIAVEDIHQPLINIPFSLQIDSNQHTIQIILEAKQKTSHSLILKIDSVFDIEGNVLSNYLWNFTLYPETKVKLWGNESSIIKVYPNPTRDILKIEFLDKNPSNAYLTITSIDGKNTMSFELTTDKNINISKLPKGAYLLYLQSENYLYTKTLLLK